MYPDDSGLFAYLKSCKSFDDTFGAELFIMKYGAKLTFKRVDSIGTNSCNLELYKVAEKINV